MDTKNLTDVLKNASEVTSLSTTDKLVITDTNGNPKRMSKSVLDSGIVAGASVGSGASGWLRIATVGANASGVIKVAVSWGRTTPAMILVSFLMHMNGYFHMQCLSRLNVSTILSKARFVYKSNTSSYIDVYAPVSTNETINMSLIGCINTFINLETKADAEVPSGYSVREFDFSASGGGGKSILFNHLRNLAERRIA